MLKVDNFFKNYSQNIKKNKENLKKTKSLFQSLIIDIKNNKIPMLESYNKNYELDFSKSLINKFLNYKNIIIIGMGGSILGSQSIYSFLKKKIKKKLFFFDNLDPNLFLKFKKIKNLKNSCFIVISKSGNTLETLINLKTIFSKSLFKKKLVIITQHKDSKLLSIGNKFNAEIIEHKSFIGGRYSVLSEVGMFPAAIMNLNLRKFKNLNKLIKNKNFVLSLVNSVASIYTYYKKGINNSVMLNYDSRLNELCFWNQQLLGESLGKKGKGINPIVSLCPKDHHSLLQLYLDGPRDKFFTFFSIKKNIKQKIDMTLDAQCRATKNIFKKKKIPYRHFILKENDEEELGSIFTFLVLETILLARLMNVNPYDQPAVEEIKIETKKILGKRG